MTELLHNEIETVCGKCFKLSFLDQIAIGIYESEKQSAEAPLIPDTYSLYRLGINKFILEITRLKPENFDLKTTYLLLSEAQASCFLTIDKTRALAP